MGAPDRLCYCPVSQDPLVIVQKQQKQIELFRRKVDRLSPHLNAACCCVDKKVAAGDSFRRISFGRGFSSQLHPHTC